MEKINRSYIRYIRYTVQWAIFFFLIYAGYRFYLFVDYFIVNPFLGFDSVLEPPVERPPSVEGFLPIGALMSLKLWITRGIFDHVHPAGLVIFTAALLMSLLLKKSFCGWICPVGAFSDLTWKIGKELLRKNYKIHDYIDYPLRSVKYLVMAFFFYVIVIKMSPFAILKFLEGDYYKISDIRMLHFFTKMTTVTFITIFVLFVLSLPFKNFWCRYLCPYGALVGLLSMCSPLKITRNQDACIHCEKCTENCPSLLPVEKKNRVSSPECTGCLTCVSHCPARGALDMSFGTKRMLKPVLFAVLVLALFFGSVGVGKMTDRWQSSVTYEEYQLLIPRASMLEHP